MFSFLFSFLLFLKNLSSWLLLFSKGSVQLFHGTFVDVALVRAKSPCKSPRNMEEFMYDGLLSFFSTKLIVAFRNHFDHVRRWKIESLLPDFPESVNARNGSSGCGSFASEAKHELWNNMEEFETLYDFVSQFLYVGSF